MAWILLVLAGLFEIGWPVGLKMAQEPATRITGIAIAVLFMMFSGALLWYAQKQIPLGTAYAVWTGIGAAGTFFVGVIAYGDPTSFLRYLGVVLIIAGVAPPHGRLFIYSPETALTLAMTSAASFLSGQSPRDT